MVAAAGRGERLGLGEPKALLLLNGRSLIDIALEQIARSGVADEVVVVAPEDVLTQCVDAAKDRARVVAGGATRRESVAYGLAAVGDVEYVMVHDAARTLTPPEVFQRVVEQLKTGSAGVVPVMPVSDTVKRVRASGLVSETVDRNDLFTVQTPQGFEAVVLREAHQRVPLDVAITDDASMVEWCGYGVNTVAGSHLSMKITEPADVQLAESLMLMDLRSRS